MVHFCTKAFEAVDIYFLGGGYINHLQTVHLFIATLDSHMVILSWLCSCSDRAFSRQVVLGQRCNRYCVKVMIVLQQFPNLSRLSTLVLQNHYTMIYGSEG